MTDYSSVYFDFIITKKPVILAPFDYEEYLSTARGHYFSYFDEMEGVIAKNWDDIIDIIKKEKYFKISEKKIDLFDRYNDGNSCEKLYNFIQEKSCLRK
jgi:CDP-glycerol glycerophosphotransferase